ncbi:glycosyltransferase family 2 protein [Akkermansiaceae bacterium]|nr:glycosyltransferase family 2 protein [Akkermansiaceae bacterium]
MLEILIPTYNRSELLSRTLENLKWSLTDGNVSVIVADNSTNGETALMIGALRKTFTFPFHYHKFKTHESDVGKSILRCISLSSSKFVWVLGDDDLVSPGAVAYLLSVLRKNQNVGLVFINYLTGKFNNNKIEKISGVFDLEEPYKSSNISALNFLPEISFISSCIFNREEFLIKNKRDYQNCYGYEFLAPMLLCSSDLEFIYIQYPLVLQRRLFKRSWDDLYPLYYFVGLPNTWRVVSKSLNSKEVIPSFLSYRSIKPLCILASSAKSRKICMSHIKNELSLLKYSILYVIVTLVPSFVAKFILRRA